ncbi:MAG: hypothetical protein HUU35_20380, partial [Armatimonadetes bacterium]|nr:hypothetical protein [Armatimonadota bacterium]
MLPALLAAGLLTGLSAAATVPLEVRNPGGTALASWPITMGVPFPRGLLTGEPSVRLSGAQGA